MANNKNNIALKTPSNVARTAPVVDVAQEIARIGLDQADADALAIVAGSAVAALDQDGRAKLAKRCDKMRDSVTSRAHDAARFIVAFAACGSCRRAARNIGLELTSSWTNLSIGMDQVPILHETFSYLNKIQDRRLVTKAREVVDDGLEGENLTRVQEKFAPFVLERVARETWAPERGGSATRQAEQKGAPAAVVINIQSGDAFKKCCNVLQADQSNIIDV